MHFIKIKDVITKSDACYVCVENIISINKKDNMTVIHTNNGERFLIDGDISGKLARTIADATLGKVIHVE